MTVILESSAAGNAAPPVTLPAAGPSALVRPLALGFGQRLGPLLCDCEQPLRRFDVSSQVRRFGLCLDLGVLGHLRRGLRLAGLTSGGILVPWNGGTRLRKGLMLPAN